MGRPNGLALLVLLDMGAQLTVVTLSWSHVLPPNTRINLTIGVANNLMIGLLLLMAARR